MNANFANRLTNFFVNFFTLDDLVPQAEAEQAIREGVSFRGTNILILIIAILIASLGLNTNSTAVIIGAMLISPLMGPIIGIGLGVGVHDFNLIKRCLRNLIMAAGFSVLASTLYFLISPVNEGHSELLARTSPTIYDVLIGFFGGGAGIIGLGSKSKGNVIPGVAIATALMPPLCTAGYGLATWQIHYFLGAIYLFLINSIYIAFATFIGVKLFKYKDASAIVDTQRAARVRKLVYTIAILTMLPSIWLTYTMLQTNKFTMNANRFVAAECNFPATQVLSKDAYTADGQRFLRIALIGRILPTDSLDMALSSRLPFYGLTGTKLIIVQGDESKGETMTQSADDIFRLTQATITRQQEEIDSLRDLTRQIASSRLIARTLSPELKVVFPQVEDLAITEPVFSSVDGTRLDTVDVALVRYSSRMTPQQLAKFREYLTARLDIKDIRIVEVGASVLESSTPKK